MTLRRVVAASAMFVVLAWAATALATGPDPADAEYRSFLGLQPRTVVWFLAELHLMFGAFVLGVPIFAVIIEYVGARNGDRRFDELAHECTRLLAAAYATTAALGGLMSFALFSLYPKVMQHLSGAMHDSFYIYGLCFFGESFTLYLYYYAWDRMRARAPARPRLARALRWPTIALAAVVAPLGTYLFFLNGDAAMASERGVVDPLYPVFGWLGAGFLVVYGVYAWAAGRKALHIYLGVLLNLWGTALMLIANSWASYMMSPSGVDPETLQFSGTTWQAVSNPLWRPLSAHRLLGNLSFGGFVVGAYAAVRFLIARRDSERAHYDWMGYVGNVVGLAGLLLLPFAGYYLGREIYSVNPVMGNDMMGGFFSWAFILQAVLVGLLLIGANYYLWAGMARIEGAQRYRWLIKFIVAGLVVAFLVWITPHNLPLAPAEQARYGSQYHPVLKYLGLMPAKNAAVNFILLSTFFSFLLYRRANKGELVAFRDQGGRARVAVVVALAVSLALVGWYAHTTFTLAPEALSLDPEREGVIDFHGWMLVAHMAVQIAAVALVFRGRGKLGQALLVGSTAVIATGVFGLSGYVVLQKANPFLRNLAVGQTLLVLACMILTTAIDLALFRGARQLGAIRWGRIGTRAQYALLLLCIASVLTMGLMGYVRAGLRQQWHIYGVLKDTSAQAATPLMAEMSRVVGAITVVFLVLVAFVFWLGTLSQRRAEDGDVEVDP